MHILNEVENEDGSVTITAEITKQESLLLIEFGFNQILREQIERLEKIGKETNKGDSQGPDLAES